MGSDRFDDDTAAPHGRAPRIAMPADGLCTFCGDSAAHATLATFGARCGRCYAEYCRNPPKGVNVPASAVPGDAGGLAWAYRLRWRHQQGEKLTTTQIGAYTEALRRRSFPTPDAA
jgi:hypothetical protein